MSAEQQKDFNLSGKSQSNIVEYLKTLEDNGKVYIFTFSHLESSSEHEVIVSRKKDNLITIKSNSDDFPHGKNYVIIKFANDVLDNKINVTDDFSIINIKEKPVPQITEVEEEDIASFMVTIENQDPVSDTVTTPEKHDESEQYEISDEMPNFEFDIEDIIEEQVEAVDVIVQQKLSQWETQLSEEKRKSLISELLLEYYKKDKNIDILDRESQVFNDLNNNRLHKDISDAISEFKPYKQLVIDGKFRDTNIYPIVEDKKIFYTNQSLPERDDPITNVFVLPKPVASITTDDEGISKTGEIDVKIQLIKDYYSGKINGYKSYISKLFEGGNVTIEDEDTSDQIEVSFNNLYATHLPASNEDINSEYYTIDNQSIETIVVRNCNDEKKCIVNPTKDDVENNLVDKSFRKSLKREFYYSDIYDDKDIVDNRGNRKKDVRTCNGTNKTGDTLYILGDEKLRKSITKPPEKKDLFSGETLKVVGMYIQSPYAKFKSIFANREYTENDNTKIYPKLFNDALDLGDIGNKVDVDSKTIIIDDITDFSYEEYDPKNNYFVYFNKSSNNVLSDKEYKDYIDSILPNTTQIVDIEIDNIKTSDSIDEVNRVINKYGLDFLHLSNEDVKKIGNNVITNIANIINQKVTDNILKYDRIELNNKFIEYNNTIVDILYQIENTQDKNSIDYIENVITEFNRQIDNYINQFSNISLLKMYAEKFLDIDNSMDELDDPNFLKDKIKARILEREGVADNRSFIIQLINRPGSISSEISEYIESYKIVNGINMSSRLYLSNLEFYSNKINQLSFLKQIKNTTFGGDEFRELLNLVNLQNIKNSIEERVSEDINSENLKRLNEEYNNSVDIFNREKEQYMYYLEECNSVKVKKIYNSLEEVLHDNDKEVKVDKQFTNINEIIKIGIHLHNSNFELDTESLNKLLKEAISKKFMFLSNREIDNYIQRYNDLKGEIGILNLGNIKATELIENNDYALLKTDKKYLFFRKSNKWISVDKDSYSQIQKCFLYKTDLLQYSLDDIENICSLTPDREADESIDCIKVGDNFIPSPMYRNYLNIQMLDKKRMLMAKLVDYKINVDSKIVEVKESLNEHIKRVHNKKVYSTSEFSYNAEKKLSKLVYPSKKHRQILEKIYSISDFDMKIEKLLEFIDNYGLQYSINPKDKDTDEANELTSKWIYYDSSKIDVPICCKHYLDYRKMLFKDNNTRQVVINEIKEKWSMGNKNGEYFICSNCGEPIDNIKYSEFEGFGKDNKVINFREKVIDDSDSNAFIMPSVIVTKNSSNDLLNLLVTKLGVKLREDDYQFIINQMDTVSKNMLNFQQFYASIYKDKNIIENDLSLSSIQRDITKSMKKTPEKIEEFKSLIKGLLNEFIENYPIDTIDDYKQSIVDFMNEKKHDKMNKKAIIIISSSLLSTVRNSYENYRAGVVLNNVLANLSQVLIYSLPSYRLVSLGAERREKQSGFFVQNLYKNPELAIPLLYNRIFQEKTATRSQPEIKKLFNNISNYFRNILQLPFSRVINDLYKLELDTIIEGVQNTNYISNLMINRNIENIDLSNKVDIDYLWPTFLPPLNPNIDQTPESLGLNNNEITTNIQSFNTNLVLLTSLNAQILDENTKESVDHEVINDLIVRKDKIIMDNNNIIHKLNNYYTKLGFLYMSVINNIIIDIDNSPYNISSYSSSLGFDKLDSKYTDYFKNNYSGKKQLIESVEIKMKEIDSFINSNKKRDNSFDMIILSHKGRDLQNYMTFNKELYKNDDEIHNYLMKQLKLINSITILDEGELKYKKRHYRVLMDEDYKLYIKFLLKPENDSLSAEDIDVQFIEYFKLVRNIDLSKNLIKKDLILKHKGYALLDIVSKKFRKDINKSVEQTYGSLSNKELFEELDRLNTEFNKSSIIEKTKTYPMINNLIPFKHNISRSINDCITDYMNSIGLEILGQYGIGDDLNIQLESVKFNNNIDDYVTKLELKRSELNTFSLTNIASLKDKLKQVDYLNSEQKMANINRMIDIQGDQLVNNEFYSEIINSSHKFIKISNTNSAKIDNQIRFKNTLIDVNSYNSDINVFTNILTIIVGYINRIKNAHINHQSSPEMKLHVKLDSKDDNVFFYGTTSYKEKLENQSKLSELIKRKIQDEEDLTFINMLPDTSNIVNLLRKLLSLNKEFNIDGVITKANITIPAVMRLYIHDLIIFYLGAIFEDYDADMKPILFEIRSMILNEISNYLFAVNRKEEDIIQTIKTKRARENINRKNAFDRMSTDMQNTQKLFRRFNIGTIFEGYEDDDVTINEALMQGQDMAEDSRENLGVEGDNQDMLFDYAAGDELFDTQLGIGIHGSEEMENIYGGDDI